ncbi:MAG: hypothetical protein IPK05_16865 [Comamonadaceae bacterium]|nr:hypothetical protein [Comamonadaceae bacterium]
MFGEANCLGIIANINNPKGRSDDKFIATAHEYLLVYSKEKTTATVYGFGPDDVVIKRYNKLDEKVKYIEKWICVKLAMLTKDPIDQICFTIFTAIQMARI